MAGAIEVTLSVAAESILTTAMLCQDTRTLVHIWIELNYIMSKFPPTIQAHCGRFLAKRL